MSMESLINSLFTNSEGVNRGPAIQEHREQFHDTEFLCDCGGHVYPFSIEQGLCSSCKEEPVLSELHYETPEREEYTQDEHDEFVQPHLEQGEDGE